MASEVCFDNTRILGHEDMAYIQDISVLMRELLKVPKDYTPTAVEISKYIRSRYSNDQADNNGKMPSGSRAYSSASRSAPPRAAQVASRRLQAQQKQQQQQQSLRLVNKHQKMSGRSITYAALQPNEKATVPPAIRNPPKGRVMERLEKTNFKAVPSRKTPARTKPRVWEEKPRTAPSPIAPVEPPLANRASFWNWQSAKNHIRRAVSDLVVTSSGPKNKLAMLGEQIKLDPKVEQALEAKKKDMLKDMVDPDIMEREPVRTREIIQRLLEENKLEDQRREIARLTELARSTVMEARKRNFVPAKTKKRREERL